VSWWDTVVAQIASPMRAAVASTGARVVAELAAAREKYPDAGAVDDRAFAAALAERLAAQRDATTALERLRVDDLLLALWCATGDSRAIATFERVFRPDIDAALARFRRLAMTPDELRQYLRVKLFVDRDGDKPARIAGYSGFGFLQNWLRVTALRALVDIARTERVRQLEELLADDDLLATPQSTKDVVPGYARERYGAAIKQAFARAVAGLAPRQRNLLRHVHVDQMTFDQIAALYGIHRATVARTLASARAELVTTTRKELGVALGLGEDALDSIVQAADSRIDLSLSRVLRAPPVVDDDGGE
jgi:RNA polymerase sigma-70 factor (ECF subfamily)